MNREIKFRAWSENDKRMVEPDELVFWNGCCYLNKSKSLNNPDKPYSASKLKGYSILEKFVMQYTGLKDKNGVEIYEGDVANFVFPNNGNVGIAPVVWEYGCWNVTDFKNEAGSNNIYNLVLYDIEVIGNIYENPELLTNK